MTEIWRDIDGYDGKYQVSNFGRVKSFKRGKPRILKVSLNSGGYLCVVLYRDGKTKQRKVHRLVAQAFIPNPDGKPEVNHIDGVKTSNAVNNLEWVTASENIRHAFTAGLKSVPQGEGSCRAKLTNEQARYIRENPDNLSDRELARQFGVTPQTISRIQRGKVYQNTSGHVREAKPHKHTPRIPDEVRKQIRRGYKPNVRGYGSYALAKKYGVSAPTILKIINEK